jgi:glucosamine-6-phosphate deaminase
MSVVDAEIVAGKVREKSKSILLLPTGTKPLGLYERLTRLHREQGLSFSGVTFFNLDEYLGLPPDHPASYHVYMEENFYGLVDADRARIHVPDGSAPDPEAECERYEAAISEAGGVDLCVLGIGRNGHIGFNEPGARFDSRTRVDWLAESTRRVNAADFEEGQVPERAITVGMETVFEARAGSCWPPAPIRPTPQQRHARGRSRTPYQPRCCSGIQLPPSSSTGRRHPP